ncbi:MAG: ABC transporter ATP-binding protein [Opitutaceae bacterium]|jgi:ABC-2 type transport system ATP-binding protein|nr:ABC transporter ATP-binding protein [Opitutaceae bacterium]
MLTARSLHKKFGSAIALHALDLNVAPGEIYALLGPNGAGKTTTINLFLGFLQPDGGSATVAGVNVALDPIRARHALAYIPEQVNLYPHFSGLENLSYFSELAGQRYAETKLRAFLQESGLQAEAHDRRVSTYSKGMRQKVGIAIALAKDAKALLLDEPTSGLDPAASHEFSALLKTLAGRGVAILMATHDLFRAKSDATRLGIMRHGRLVHELGGPEVRAADLEKLYLESIAD